MKIKYKSGYTVEISNADAKKMTPTQIDAEARKAVRALVRNQSVTKKKTKDSVIKRNFSTQVGFFVTEIKNAIKNEDWKTLDKELLFVIRDMDADLEHDDYKDMYTSSQLKEVLKAYKNVYEALSKIKGISKYSALATDILEKYNELEVIFDVASEKEEVVNPVKVEVEDVPPFYDPTVSISVGGDYKHSRVEKGGRYKNQETLLLEFEGIVSSIQEDIDNPALARKFRKDELRKVIERYRTYVTIFKQAKLLKEANVIKRKVNELSFAWHLEIE